MKTYGRVQTWLQDLHSYQLPPLDERGLSRTVINDTIILHILAAPSPGPLSADSLFFYVPLASTAGIGEANLEKVLYFVGEKNMMGALPTGFRLALNQETGFFWLVGQFFTEHMDAKDFETCVKQCLFYGEELFAQLDALLEGADIDDNTENLPLNNLDIFWA